MSKKILLGFTLLSAAPLSFGNQLPERTVVDTLFTHQTVSGTLADSEVTINAKTFHCSFRPRFEAQPISGALLTDEGLGGESLLFNKSDNKAWLNYGQSLQYAMDHTDNPQVLSVEIKDQVKLSRSCFIDESIIKFQSKGISLEGVEVEHFKIGSIESGVYPGLTFNTCMKGDANIRAQALQLLHQRLTIGAQALEPYKKEGAFLDDWYQDGYLNYQEALSTMNMIRSNPVQINGEECFQYKAIFLIMHLQNPEIILNPHHLSFSYELKRMDQEDWDHSVLNEPRMVGQEVMLRLDGRVFQNYENMDCFNIVIIDHNNQETRVSVSTQDVDREFKVTLPLNIKTEKTCELIRKSRTNPNWEIEMYFILNDKA